MPALSRSLNRVSLKVLSRSAFFASWVEGLKSEAASRTFSTPRPVPVRIQSWAELVADSTRSIAIAMTTECRQRRIGRDIESHGHRVRLRDTRVDFVFQPVLRHLALHILDIPGVTAAEIAAASAESESTLGSAGAEHAVGTADRAALTIRNLI